MHIHLEYRRNRKAFKYTGGPLAEASRKRPAGRS